MIRLNANLVHYVSVLSGLCLLGRSIQCKDKVDALSIPPKSTLLLQGLLLTLCAARTQTYMYWSVFYWNSFQWLSPKRLDSFQYHGLTQHVTQHIELNTQWLGSIHSVSAHCTQADVTQSIVTETTCLSTHAIPQSLCPARCAQHASCFSHCAKHYVLSTLYTSVTVPSRYWLKHYWIIS